MNIAETFGKMIENRVGTDPEKAQRILRAGWQAVSLRNRFVPDRRLAPSGRYLAKMLMDMMLSPLRSPDDSAIVSILTPCELIHLFGLNPYNAEAYSSFIAASECGGPFLRQTEANGLPETLCSYHRIFLGAAESGMLPRPKCIISTNLACDANQLTFKRMAAYFNVPHFMIEVPYTPDPSAVEYVAGQLRELYHFLENVTGKHPSLEKLTEIMQRSRKTMDTYEQYQIERGANTFLQDLPTPLYEFGAVNILRGTPQSLTYAEMAYADAQKAEPFSGTKIYWVHTIPHWMESAKKLFTFNKNAQIVGMDVTTSAFTGFNPADPYRAMAKCLVYSSLNGSHARRIEHALQGAKATGAHGAVWFCHWGCRRTMIAANEGKRRFEEEGIPVLILNGDSIDRTGGGSEQAGTRLEAFLEMLGDHHG